jgi:hypothetical protein
MTTIGALAPGAFQKRKSLGQVAYEAYYERAGGLSLVSGYPLPVWDAQHDEIKEAWEAAAQAVKSES